MQCWLGFIQILDEILCKRKHKAFHYTWPGFSYSCLLYNRVALVGHHEDQLAAITSLCKQEMKLLLSAKKLGQRVSVVIALVHIDKTTTFLLFINY